MDTTSDGGVIVGDILTSEIEMIKHLEGINPIKPPGEIDRLDAMKINRLNY
jgi:hypothetical protein